MADIAPDDVTFREQLKTITDSTRVIIQVDRNFKCLADIRDFRHIIGQYVQTMEIKKDAIFGDLRQAWYNLYDLLDMESELNVQLSIAYNMFGIGFEVTISTFDDIVIYEDENFYDTFHETPIYLRFIPASAPL